MFLMGVCVRPEVCRSHDARMRVFVQRADLYFAGKECVFALFVCAQTCASDSVCYCHCYRCNSSV